MLELLDFSDFRTITQKFELDYYLDPSIDPTIADHVNDGFDAPIDGIKHDQSVGMHSSGVEVTYSLAQVMCKSQNSDFFSYFITQS